MRRSRGTKNKLPARVDEARNEKLRKIFCSVLKETEKFKCKMDFTSEVRISKRVLIDKIFPEEVYMYANSLDQSKCAHGKPNVVYKFVNARAYKLVVNLKSSEIFHG